MKACKGVENMRDAMDMQQVLQMRSEGNIMYYDFISYSVSAVIGKMNYKKKSCSIVLLKYATVSDEAIALLILENNYETWMDMALTGNTKTSKVLQKETNGGKSQGKVATSQHNRGWSDEGLCQFNELFDLVQKNRETPFAKEYEENFRKWCEAKAAGNKRKKVEKLYVEAVQVRHELWSDDEEEGVAISDPYEGTDHKWVKLDDIGETFSVTEKNSYENELLPTPSSDDDDESEDDMAKPIEDQPVFKRAKC